VQDSAYSRLIGIYVNDAKREVEDAYDWNSLSTTLTAETIDSVFNYVLEDSGTRFRVIDILNDTTNIMMDYAATNWMDQQFLLIDQNKGSPAYYNFNGVDVNGDTQVDIFPIPDGVYTLRFNLIVPQLDLALDNDRILVAGHLVCLLAYAKAIAERGEDAGIMSSEAYQLYKMALADYVSIERNRYLEEMVWVNP
jgi:hypothetical protein